MRHIVVGTAGHIDHGKSALVLALTGTDPDRLKEEKARGITIDLGFAHWTEGETTFSFVDVPGHERFVKNMLAGVGGFDCVVLVVAADESVMPQTREHFEICRLLQVPAGLVALTKADLVDEEMLELARLEVRELVAGSFLDGAPIVAVSSRTGVGLDDLRRALVKLAATLPPRRAAGVTRLPIDRAFSVKGFGTVVTGTLASGSVGTDDLLVLQPGERPAKVRGVQVHGAHADRAVGGQRAAVNLALDLSEVTRGDSLVTPGVFDATRMTDARLDLLASAKPLRHGARVRFHQGTAELIGRVAVASVIPTEIEDQGAHPVAGEVPPGRSAYVRIRLEAPAVLARGDRFILRAYSPPVTIAGGVVLDPNPARGPIRNHAAQLRFAGLDPALSRQGHDVERAAAALLHDRGGAGLPVAALVSRLGVSPSDVDRVVAELVTARQAVRAGATLVAPDRVDALERQLLQLLGDHHRATPLSEGMPREEVRERLFARTGDGVFELVMATLQQAGKVSGRDRLALASHRVELSPDEERARAIIEDAIRAGGLKPPEASAAATEGAVPAVVTDRILKFLVRQRRLVKLDALYFHEEALEGLKRDVRALKTDANAAPTIDVSTFKDRYGISRKFAIPLLEYLDRERVTRRQGDTRVVI